MSKVVCPGCKRSLDDVIESLIRQRGKFKGQREGARAERDRYRAALEQIASVRGPLIEADPATLGHGFEQIAKEALNG